VDTSGSSQADGAPAASAATPLIAVLTGHFPDDRASVHRTYLNAIWLAGGQPVVLSPPPAGALNRALSVLDHCDAVLLTGGGDVDPARYGEEAKVPLMNVDSSRDTFELAAVDRAIAAGLPVLGICRGMQVLAVALGGKLHQDLPSAGYAGHWDDVNAGAPVHGIRATPGSLAARALAGRLKVNSVHHQAVADPGPHLAATAWSSDHVIEAVEAADGSPLLGLQWHPERMACPAEADSADLHHLAPFTWLVGMAGGTAPAAPVVPAPVYAEPIAVPAASNGNGHRQVQRVGAVDSPRSWGG
jgi:putative glutamine amidotransferase